jgi:hypothetical protein
MKHRTCNLEPEVCNLIKFKQMKKLKYLFIVLMASHAPSLFAQLPAGAPSWTKDLVIYEISPISFTSPQGPETGTFNS